MMLQEVQQPQAETMLRRSAGQKPADWRVAAIAAFRQTEHGRMAAMRATLATRVRALTGHAVTPASILVDRDGCAATVVLDGVVFRLRRRDLMLVRACSACGLGEFESQPIEDLAGLGHALAIWEPRCPHCYEGEVDDADSSL